MTEKLQGKVALITGAGNGIGRQTALLFASEGAAVVVADYKEEAARETVDLITQAGGRAAAVAADVSKAEEVQFMVEFAVKTFGKLSILINNAGVGTTLASISKITEEDWDWTVNVNMKGVWLGMKYGIPALQAAGGGTIVNLASAAGIVGTPAMGAYGASKAGVIQLTKTAALECAKQNIRVNAVCPAFTRTNMVDQLIDNSRNPERAEQSLISNIPIGRLGEAIEIARAIFYLASDDSSFTTGHALVLDGGLTIQ